jgi:Tfp pilus assembly protein PilF
VSPGEQLAAAINAHESGHLAVAEGLYRQVIAEDPNNAVAYNNLGNLYRNQDRFDQAIACYERAIQIAPWVPEIYNNLGVALRDQKDPASAVQAFQRALQLRPDYFEALNNLANALKDQGELDAAITCYRRAAELNPQHTLVLDNLGLACIDLGLYDEADACFQRSLAIDASSPHVHWSRSILLLLRGELAAGWQEHEWRWRCPEWRRYCQLYLPPEHPQPLWDGSRLEGRTILLQTEQGFGDTIQFVRYVPLVKQAGGRVLLECQRPLLKLLAGCGADELIGEGDPLPPFDVRVRASLISLPAIFQTTLDSIPANVPYLQAEPALIAKWRERLSELCPSSTSQPLYRVGVNWRGRPGQGIYRARDFPLEALQPLAELPGVRLISLQRGEGRSDLVGPKRRAWAADSRAPLDLGDEVDTTSGAFMDTAAIMKNIDLVITSDTAVAHLAGALGVPTWVALPSAPDWRWLLERTDSPWYPTMRLFRQKTRGDWTSVFAEMVYALSEQP